MENRPKRLAPSPSNRLVNWSLLLLPAALMGAFGGVLEAFAILLYGLVFAVAVVDLWLSRNRFTSLNPQMPAVVRLAKDSRNEVPMHLEHQGCTGFELEVGLLLPAHLGAEKLTTKLRIEGTTGQSSFGWPCKPTRRGTTSVEVIHLGFPSRFGFWKLRRRYTVKSEWRVYPNLASEYRSLAGLFLNRGSSGIHRQRQLGRGREFEKLREYQPGDSVEDVAWKASAKRQSLVTRVYQVERTQEVYAIIDASRLSTRVLPVRDTDRSTDTVLDRYITAATLLGMAIQRQNDLFGLSVFSDGIDSFIRAKSGVGHRQACTNTLYGLHARTVAPDFSEIITSLKMRLRKRALLLFLTDLHDTVAAEQFLEMIPLLSRQHVVIVHMLSAEGTQPLFTSEPPAGVEQICSQIDGHVRWQRLNSVRENLARHHVRCDFSSDERFCTDLINRYIEVKQRQLI
ncbi:MAG: DUF58 domain-containing protein [Verrucomicrobiota bacterium]|nr:DUF58 domain-containing protein [Verrucomicrobiota bacterium]